MSKQILLHSRKGFSILMAIGTIAVLLIVVSNLAVSYMRESRLSRFAYDDVIAHYAAEGTFEYAMLKVKNHRDGFQDALTIADPDKDILSLNTPRSDGLKIEYEINAASTGATFSVASGSHLIVPLFSASGQHLPMAIYSKDPNYVTGVTNTSNLSVNGIGGFSWSIVAMSGSQSVALTGSGDITLSTRGNIRIQSRQCYSGTGSNIGDGIDCGSLDPTRGDEEIVYFYDQSMGISQFLTDMTDPYILIYNSDTNSRDIVFGSNTDFALPTSTVTATAKKGGSSQVFRFTEDKGKYYDTLKYGIYNTH